MKRVVASDQNTKYTIRLNGNEIQLLRVAVQELMPRVSDGAASQLKNIEDQLKSTLSSAPVSPRDEYHHRLEETYSIDAHAVDLLMDAQNNLNTEAGYQAYYSLAKYLHETNQPDGVLYDLAADFSWDDRLSDAVRRLAQADGFDDIPSWA
jgi:hypothetical protein